VDEEETTKKIVLENQKEELINEENLLRKYFKY